MRIFPVLIVTFFLLLVTGCDSTGLKISNPWIREVPEGIGTTALYLNIKNNNSTIDYLKGVDTDIAGTAEIHQTSVNENGISYMKKLDRLELPPSRNVALEPGGTHVMLIGLNRKIKDGDKVKIVLEFEKEGNREITATVRGFKNN